MSHGRHARHARGQAPGTGLTWGLALIGFVLLGAPEPVTAEDDTVAFLCNQDRAWLAALPRFMRITEEYVDPPHRREVRTVLVHGDEIEYRANVYRPRAATTPSGLVYGRLRAGAWLYAQRDFSADAWSAVRDRKMPDPSWTWSLVGRWRDPLDHFSLDTLLNSGSVLRIEKVGSNRLKADVSLHESLADGASAVGDVQGFLGYSILFDGAHDWRPVQIDVVTTDGEGTEADPRIPRVDFAGVPAVPFLRDSWGGWVQAPGGLWVPSEYSRVVVLDPETNAYWGKVITVKGTIEVLEAAPAMETSGDAPPRDLGDRGVLMDKIHGVSEVFEVRGANPSSTDFRDLAVERMSTDAFGGEAGEQAETRTPRQSLSLVVAAVLLLLTALLLAVRSKSG